MGLRTPPAASPGAVGRIVRLTAVAVPVAIAAAYLVTALASGSHEMVDLHNTYLRGARLYLHRDSPYAPAAEISTTTGPFYYPPQMAAVFVPLAALPFQLAVILFAVVAAAAVPAALWLLDVHDVRVYGTVALSLPVLSSIGLGNVSTLLLLAAAAAWRWRNQTRAVATVVALAVGTKLFLWPLLAWLWFSGRRAAAAVTACAVAATTVVAWSWIGFADLSSFPTLLQRASRFYAPMSYAPLGHFGSAGFGVASIVGVLCIGLACRRGDDLGYLAAVAVALLVTPTLWLHYLALLPLVGVRSRRFGLAWVAPLALWVTPRQLAWEEPWRVGLVLAVVAIIGAAAVVRRVEPGLPAPSSVAV
jgi:hypothetical protein